MCSYISICNNFYIPTTCTTTLIYLLSVSITNLKTPMYTDTRKCESQFKNKSVCFCYHYIINWEYTSTRAIGPTNLSPTPNDKLIHTLIHFHDYFYCVCKENRISAFLPV